MGLVMMQYQIDDSDDSAERIGMCRCFICFPDQSTGGLACVGVLYVSQIKVLVDWHV